MSKAVENSTLEEMYAPTVSLDYQRYCNQVKFSFVAAVSLLAVEIILFRTVGDLKGIIIGFSCAQGMAVLFGLVSNYYAYKFEDKIAMRRMTTTPCDDLVSDVINCDPDMHGDYEVLKMLDKENLEKAILALNNLYKNNTLNRAWKEKMSAIRSSIKQNPHWAPKGEKPIRDDINLVCCSDFLNEIDKTELPMSLADVVDTIGCSTS